MIKQIPDMQRLFKALADSTRLRILGLLLTGEVCVCHIHETLRVRQSKASRHLAYLRRAKLVETRRDGLWIYYRLAEPSDQLVGAIAQAVRHVLGHVGDVQSDVERLRRKTGCCLPAMTDATMLSCCGGTGCGPGPQS